MIGKVKIWSYVEWNPVDNGHIDSLMIGQPLWWLEHNMERNIVVGEIFNAATADIDKVFAVMALCPKHTFLLQTAYPERMAEYMRDPNRSRMWAHQAMEFPVKYRPIHITLPLPNVRRYEPKESS